MAEASKKLSGVDSSAKNELLFRRGTNFNDLPSWQRRGSALYWTHVEREGHNPLTQETVTTVRRRLHLDEDLPLGDDYGDFLRRILTVGTRLAGR